MERATLQTKQKRYAWLFLEVSEEEKVFYQRFVARHGGAFGEVEQPAGGYRLDFPPGTRIVLNEEERLPLEESYHLLYPDGVRITWYRAIKVDRACCAISCWCRCLMMTIGRSLNRKPVRLPIDSPHESTSGLQPVLLRGWSGLRARCSTSYTVSRRICYHVFERENHAAT